MELRKELDYLFVLKALRDIPFGVGRKLLIDFLQGEDSNESIRRNKLSSLENFGTLAYDKDELNNMIDNLLLNNMIQTNSVNGNKFWKVLELSPAGLKEIENPSLYKRKLSFNLKETKTEITEEDKKSFQAFGPVLSEFNDEQKKAIICSNKHILCLAGAGSGKTTVLTKRIEFMIRYRSVNPGKILAITFTRKARQEMMARLEKAGFLNYVSVETFNSFCEKILRRHNDVVYQNRVRVTGYKDKVAMINNALKKLNMNISQALSMYFTFSQRRGKTEEQLANIFMNDCFFVRDYFKLKNKRIEKASFDVFNAEDKKTLDMVLGVCNYIEAYMKKYGLRDFTDQLIDAINLFEKHRDLIPKFEHILIDEYQDVNSTQIRLVDILAPENVFCVGDPRQSIYGWRGSDIRYILNFEQKYPDTEVITLTKNYRSTEHIVDLINTSIKNMGLADLEHSLKGEKDINLLKFDSEGAEFEFVIQRVIASKIPRSEIFVLARTNRQLNELSQMMRLRKIRHVVRSDELRRSVVAGRDDITLATVHAIKGLEAKMVFVIGCNKANFPCRGSEHPVIDMVRVEEYDKEEEERRLFYVAMSRAKNSLYLTYSGSSSTYFVTDKMMEILDERNVKSSNSKKTKFNLAKSNDVITRLKEWRKALSREQNIPAYIIMHDRTIIDIAVKTPLSLNDLEKVIGLGPAKISKYGDEILGVVNGLK